MKRERPKTQRRRKKLLARLAKKRRIKGVWTCASLPTSGRWMIYGKALRAELGELLQLAECH